MSKRLGSRSSPPRISKRALETPASPIRKLVPLADRARKAGVRVYHLNIGQPDIPSPPEFLKAIRAFREPVVAYEDSLGNPKLRAGLARYYKRVGIAVDPSEVIVTTGGSEAILFALLSVCDPGQECLVCEPFYTNYLGFATQAGVKLAVVPTSPQTGFHLPAATTWEHAVGPKTRAILIANPNNPTGTVYHLSELRALDRFARAKHLFLIADETYREFVYDGRTHHSLLSLGKRPSHVILVDSLSKRYSLCGARIGCLVSHNQEVLGAATKFAQARLSAPTIEQQAAIQALKIPQTKLAAIRREYQARRDLVLAALSKMPGVFIKKPEGAFYCVAKLPLPDAEAFARWLLTDFRLDRATVMLAPANGFYLSPNLGRDEVRIAYVLNTRSLARAMTILAQALAHYPKRTTKTP